MPLKLTNAPAPLVVPLILSDGRVRQGHGPHIGVNEAAIAVCNVVNEGGVGDGHSTSFDKDGGS